MPDAANCESIRFGTAHRALRCAVIILLLAGIAGFSAAVKDGQPYQICKVARHLLRATKIMECHREHECEGIELRQGSSVPSVVITEVCWRFTEWPRALPALPAWVPTRQFRSPPSA